LVVDDSTIGTTSVMVSVMTMPLVLMVTWMQSENRRVM
jgi:hypothetical protein